MTEGQAVHVDTKQLANAVTGFQAASKETNRSVDTMRTELSKYANANDFQGPAADAFRKLHAEISDDLDQITAQTKELSNIVNEANTKFLAETNRAAAEMPSSTSGRSTAAGGGIHAGLTPPRPN